MERVSTCGLTQSLISATLSMQSRMAEVQVQSASGLVSDSYAGLGTDSATLISLETELSRMNTWSDNTSTASTRITSMYNAVDSMNDIMSSLRATISGALSSTDDSIDYNEMANGLLEEFASLLNVQVDGRYLFAGGDTKSPAVPSDSADYSVVTVPSTADTSYYEGDSSIASVRVSEDRAIDYGVTADDTAFEKAIRAISIIANATTDPIDETAFTEAYDLATEALDDLISVQSGLALKAEQLERAQYSQEATITLVEEAVTNIKAADTAEVSVKLAEYETLLQASYSALASVTSLSLLDYL